MLPPKDGAKDKDHELGPGGHHPVLAGDVKLAVALLPFVADVQEPLRIIGADAVQSCLNRPAHLVRIVDRPGVDRPAVAVGVVDEPRAEVRHPERVLQHVEGDVGGVEELSGVRGREADVGGWEGREVFDAEGEVFGGPDAEDDAPMPGPLRVRFDRVDGAGNQPDNVRGIVVQLEKDRPVC